MAARFRSNMASDKTKTYHLSAAPQCPFPDASMPLDMLSQLDFVWVQFYNNGPCNLDQAGFQSAVRAWSQGIGSAKLFVGAVASSAGGSQGYVPAAELESTLRAVDAMGLDNYGGVMLWEAQLAVDNGDYQREIASVV